jgi:hypothetical protein
MPDWVTHIVVAWTACIILGLKYKQFDTENIIIVLIGSLIPDIFKLYLPLEVLGIYSMNFIAPIHMPIGSLIIATISSLFFKEKKLIFMFLILGIITHYSLDLLLTHVSGGIYLLFPFSWVTWQFGIIPVDDYYINIIALIFAFSVYITSKYYKRNQNIKFTRKSA